MVLFRCVVTVSRPALDDLGEEPRGASAPAPGLLFHPSHRVRRDIESPPSEDTALLRRAPLGARLHRAPEQLPVWPAHLPRDRRPDAALHDTAGQRQAVVLNAQPSPEDVPSAPRLRARFDGCWMVLARHETSP